MLGLSKRPWLYGLPHLSQEAKANGVFGWPPVSGGGEVVPVIWQKYLCRLYARGLAGEAVIAVAFPGFHDIYKDVGLRIALDMLTIKQERPLLKLLSVHGRVARN